MWQTEFFEKSKSPPTREKHSVLRAALGDWLARAPAGPRVIFDGFAGAGRFAAPPGAPVEDGLGSPLLLLRWSENAPGPLRFVFAEKSPVNHALLRDALGAAAAGREVELHRATFAAYVPAVTTTAPAGALFSFVDPYGCEGVTHAALCALAACGDLVFHLATHRVYAKLVTASGASPRQARRMDALLGEVVPWAELRAQARDAGAAGVLALLPALVARGLARAVPGTTAQVIALRDGRSHLVHARHRGGLV